MKQGMKKGVVGVLGAALACTLLVGCGGDGGSTEGTDNKNQSSYKIEMVTDTGGVNDRSFNQSSWEGLQQMQKDKGDEVSYLESKQESDYKTNLDKAVDGGNNLVWGIGFSMADAVEEAAKANPDVQFAIIDNAYEKPLDNVTGVTFRAQEPSFLVGYIAARTTKTGKVGFVGGISGVVIDQFDYGYKAGVAYANKKFGTNVQVVTQYADSFSDSAKGKAIATKMYSDGCDIVFHAAGGAGVGVIEAAKESGKLVIGVDRDQSAEAPDNVLTSAMKYANKAMVQVSTEIQEGKKGGRNIDLGYKEGCVGIPEDHHLMSEDTYKEAKELEQKIINGEITPPENEKAYNEYVATLK